MRVLAVTAGGCPQMLKLSKIGNQNQKQKIKNFNDVAVSWGVAHGANERGGHTAYRAAQQGGSKHASALKVKPLGDEEGPSHRPSETPPGFCPALVGDQQQDPVQLTLNQRNPSQWHAGEHSHVRSSAREAIMSATALPMVTRSLRRARAEESSPAMSPYI